MKKSSAARALIIVGHGSRMAGFAAAMRRSARQILRGGAFGQVICAYLEIVPPTPGEAVELAAARGAREIIVVPYFLQAGMHARRDIPAMVAAARRRLDGVARVRLAPLLGHDPQITALILRCVRQAR